MTVTVLKRNELGRSRKKNGAVICHTGLDYLNVSKFTSKRGQTHFSGWIKNQLKRVENPDLKGIILYTKNEKDQVDKYYISTDNNRRIKFDQKMLEAIDKNGFFYGFY